MLPPVLEIYVVHHPEDRDGAKIAQEIFDHFHGTVFSGLIGGAMAVYVRSEGWRAPGGAPRPLPLPTAGPVDGVDPARLVAIVPVLSLPLARHVQDGGEWREYVERVVSIQRATADRMGVFPVVGGAFDEGSHLAELFGGYQRIAAPSGLTEPEPAAELRCRDLAQGIAQLAQGGDARLQVFISHTRRAAPGEEEDVPALIRLVREIIQETRLRHFFDATDLQPGRDWDEELRVQAARSAMLAVRTDLYASRMWCQREMVTAKRAGMPVVILDSLGRGEERGSFLMDHIARVPVREASGGWNKADIRRGLNLLADECLKRALWRIQQQLATEMTDLAVDWWAPHAPEPVTLAHWLREAAAAGREALGARDLRILHPDPPLGPDERDALLEMVTLMGHRGALDVMTPRALAARGV